MDVRLDDPDPRIRDLAYLLFLEELFGDEWVERWARERGKLDALRASANVMIAAVVAIAISRTRRTYSTVVTASATSRTISTYSVVVLSGIVPPERLEQSHPRFSAVWHVAAVSRLAAVPSSQESS